MGELVRPTPSCPKFKLPFTLGAGDEHHGTVVDDMPSLPGVVYVEWQAGADVAAGHYTVGGPSYAEPHAILHELEPVDRRNRTGVGPTETAPVGILSPCASRRPRAACHAIIAFACMQPP